MKAGFTLLEVVVALLVLEVSVVGAVGMLVLASSTLSRAERLERATATAEGVLDSLARGTSPGSGSVASDAGEISWTVDDSGRVSLTALAPSGEPLFEIHTLLAGP